ncbi:MAG: hypothetical protein KDI13_11400, partial [Alphaproteobacteria bacterium]|nr:hypothetical protein [Alphaproteobacteria bacterium]
FDVSTGAFRAGSAATTEWNDSNIGDHSIGLGFHPIASGNYTFVAGYAANATQSHSIAIGRSATVTAQFATAIGYTPTASGTGSVALGHHLTASGGFSTAIGHGTNSGGLYSIAMGRDAITGDGTANNGSGDGSMAIGLMDDAVTITTKPKTSGIQSMGVFMGDQDGVDFAANNTMGLFGGNMVIDPAIPATQLTARGVIDVGAATDAVVLPSGTTAQRPGTPVNGMIRYNGTTAKFEGYENSSWTNLTAASPAGSDRQIQFNSGGSLAAAATFVYTAAGDFIVGSYQTNDTGTGSEDNRMFFDVSTGAFRAGQATGTQWDDSSIGAFSTALGRNTTASGDYSIAVGDSSSASGTRSTTIGYSGISSAVGSVSFGYNPTASGNYSAAIGRNTVASGYYGTAIGRDVIAGNGTAGSGNGDGSLAIGLMDDAITITTAPQISGIQSMGVFMGDQDGVDFAANNTMGLFGGNMVIDPAIPATQLTARGVIDVGAATDAVVLPSGTTAQRPGTPVNGMIRYNGTTAKFEGYENSSWTNLTAASPAGSDR